MKKGEIEIDENSPKLTGKQIRFCEEYIVDFNGHKAALRAGYAKGCARSQASKMLCNVVLADYIKKLLIDGKLGPDETVKLISDTAKSSLNDYFTIREVEHTPRVKKGLAVLIKEIQEEIDLEEEFASEAGLSDEEYDDHLKWQNKRRLKKLKYQVELRRNPKAYRIVDGQTVLIEVPELDLLKIVKDKESGKIKSVTPTQFGTKVEMYAADAALVNIARIHGLFEKDNERVLTGKNGAPLQAPVTFISAESLTDDQIEKFINGRTGNEGI